jgi:hypothetical protein
MKNDIRGLRLENDAWIYSYRIAGRARRMTIGRSSAGLTPQDARKAAQHFAGLVALGRCPASERKASRRREVMTSAPIKDHVERVAAAYLKHAKARTRESTFRETKRVFTVEILPAWKGRIGNLESRRAPACRAVRQADEKRSRWKPIARGVQNVSRLRRRDGRSNGVASRRNPPAGARNGQGAGSFFG